MVSRELDAEKLLLFHIRRDPEFLFSLAVPRIQIVVADRPIHELRHGWVIGFHLEIGWHEPQAGSEPMGRPAGDAIIGAGEWPRAFLNEIALFWVRPVAKASLGEKTHHRRPSGIHRAGILELMVGIKNFGRVMTLRHLRGGHVEPLHVVIDVGRNPVAGFEDDNLFSGFAQFMCNQRAGKTGTDDRDIAFNARFGGGHCRLL